MQCMSVDLPEPEGPITAVNRPRSNVTLTSARARTAACPAPYVFCRFTACAACAGAKGAPAPARPDNRHPAGIPLDRADSRGRPNGAPASADRLIPVDNLCATCCDDVDTAVPSGDSGVDNTPGAVDNPLRRGEPRTSGTLVSSHVAE